MKETITESFLEISHKFPRKTATLHKENGVYFPTSFRELEESVREFAGELQTLGVKKGDRVAILSENRPEWVISDLGIMLSGGIVVPVHTTLNARAISNILRHCEAKIIIVSNRELLNKIFIFQKELPFLEKIIFLETIADGLKTISEKPILSWKKLLERGEKNEFTPVFLDSDDVCTIIYTSGTTGEPKGVMLTHYNFLSNAQAVTEVIPLKEKDVFLSFLPLSHVLERLAGYYIPLLKGITIAYAEGLKQLPYNLKEVKPTILISVPRVFEKFDDKIWDKVNASSALQKKIFLWAVNQKKGSFRYRIAEYLVFKKIRKQLGGHLRIAVSGGASLNEKIAKFFWKIGVKILEGYGLTETSPVISVNSEEGYKFGTVGRHVSGVKVKISPEKEILVKGPNVMQAYYKNPEETKKAFDEEGWFCTGDLGFVDNEGFLTVVGRKKEMIVTSYGKNVWPEKIENEVNKDPYVAQAMVIGHNRKFIAALIVPDWGEVKNFLIKNNLQVQDPERLVTSQKIVDLLQERINLINQNLSSYEQIKKFKLLDEEFSSAKEELTPTLKLRRHIIEKHYQKEIEGMYS